MKRSRIRYRRKKVPKEIKDHWDRVAKMGCVITGRPGPTIHHVHGGSIIDLFGYAKAPGTGQKQNDWLVIPLAAEYHTGDKGIDNGMGKYKGVAEWENTFGTQAGFLEEIRIGIIELYGYDIFERAGVAARTE